MDVTLESIVDLLKDLRDEGHTLETAIPVLEGKIKDDSDDSISS